jgi:hypothetical protein
MDETFGLDYGWFDRTAIWSSRLLVDYNTLPQHRTMSQKFQIESVKALTKLLEMKLISYEQEENYLSSFLYKEISQKDTTYNPGAFAFLSFAIIEYSTLRFNSALLHQLFNYIKNPNLYVNTEIGTTSSQLLKDYIQRYGLTCEDLIRYIRFIQNYNKSLV